jgi:hypothetical protein
MPSELIFTHPKAGKLTVDIKPDQITWSYGLNTVSYPTYGGEVVQILSCFIEDMVIAGTTRNYRKLEEIHRYFINYIQIATQGGGGSFDPRPIQMRYPHRGWTFGIHPKGLPRFQYGRDVVAPVWMVVSAVAEPDQDLEAKVMDKAMMEAVESSGDFKLFGKVTGNIGYEPDDPFRTPFVTSKKPGTELRNAYGDLGDFYNKLIPAYLNSDFDELSADYSRPTFFKADIGRQKPGANPGTDQAQRTVDNQRNH